MATAPAIPGFPRGVLAGAAALILFSILAAGTARLVRSPEARPEAAPVATRLLQFHDGADGAVEVIDAGSGRMLDRLAPGTNGFVRSALRALVTRWAFAGAHADSFRLTAWADGRLTLDDPETHGVIDLEAFGSTNAAAFARLLTLKGDTP